MTSILYALLAPLLAAAAAAPADAQPTAKPRKLSDAEVESIVTPLLKENETLEHAVFQGNFGPSPQTILVLARDPDSYTALEAFALVPKDGGGWRKIPIDSVEEGSMIEVTAVLLDDVDGDGVIDPIVMTTYMLGFGPRGTEENPLNFAVSWKDGKFVRLKAVEKKIGKLDTAAKVRAALKKLKAPKKK